MRFTGCSADFFQKNLIESTSGSMRRVSLVRPLASRKGWAIFFLFTVPCNELLGLRVHPMET
jgi:hypothetical protein